MSGGFSSETDKDITYSCTMTSGMHFEDKCFVDRCKVKLCIIICISIKTTNNYMKRLCNPRMSIRVRVRVFVCVRARMRMCIEIALVHRVLCLIIRTAQSTYNFTSLADLFDQIPPQLLREASNQFLMRMLLLQIPSNVYNQALVHSAE